MLAGSVQELAQSYGSYEKNLELILKKINSLLNIDLMSQIKEISGDFNFGALLSSIINSLTDIVSSTLMIVFYSIFLFIEETNFEGKLKKIFIDKAQYEQAYSLINKIEISVAKYLGLKTLVSFITGILSFAILAFIGIDSPLFWAFLIFIFNFIPTVGSLIGTLFPACFCLMQFGELLPFALVLILVGLVQLIVGNLLEPKLMGNSMNISPLVAIISLSIWGAIWGINGMILSVPITVILIIVFSHFPKTRSIAILLSEKGNIS
jgi:predicted PurR-regulated permease PerM